jgi:AcrR family transcriptional regulator
MSEKRERMNPSVRREQILASALDMATKHGYASLTRDALAAHAGVAKGQIHHTFNTMTQLRRAVMRAAVHRELRPIIAQGLAQGDKDAHAAPEWLKRESLELLMGGNDDE